MREKIMNLIIPTMFGLIAVGIGVGCLYVAWKPKPKPAPEYLVSYYFATNGLSVFGHTVVTIQNGKDGTLMSNLLAYVSANMAKDNNPHFQQFTNSQPVILAVSPLPL